ncbi:MAG TPA: mechanosensitive ion channel family protein [Marmoricola sp.]|nr:mechanosensitive ion channel family protein [Marmoricola sp.]HNI71526.1 mechanosensitive ion channel family protein [Marmoricola sp.]HNJ77809.1 mechanosensitive ion channel family protein [Marmoricola sp.]HNN47455.1 mechanosensitive ion channel family protein [Marmoricola sp.]HNO39214.1 mechanosensitive ion channel family protein [Marmoricola sp.]
MPFFPDLELPRVCAESQSLTCATVYDLTGNPQLSRAAEWWIGKPLTLIGIVVGAIIIRLVLVLLVNRITRKAVERRVRESTSSHHDRRNARIKSLGSLTSSITSVVVFGIALVMVLSELGVNVAPILASAGVVGVAIGFGAQSLVKDFLSGISMMLEDQYGVGDVVNLGQVTGTVEHVGLRVTRLRDVNGTVWYVRNGEILSVGNQSQNWARTVLDISVSYSEDLTRVQELLHDVAEQLHHDEEFSSVVLEEPDVWGVQSMSADAVVIRLTMKTAPMEQWRVARELRQRIKTRFDEEGISMPHAQKIIWEQQSKGT